MSVPDCMYLATFNAFGGDVTPSSWFDHPIHYHPLTQPYIVSQVNLCNNASYNPPGYSVPASLNNAGSGQQMANWRKYYEARLNGPHSAAGKPISPAIYFQNLGQTQDGFTPYPNTSVLCLNSADKIVTAPTAISGFNVPYVKNGIAALKSDVTAILASYQANTTLGFAEYPSDFEDPINVNYACLTTSDGFVAGGLADGRASDANDTVDGVQTFAAAISGRKNLAGNTFTYQANQVMYNNPNNYDMLSFMAALRQRNMDWAHDQAVRQVIRSAFPGTPVGVYGLCCSSQSRPQPEDKAYIYNCLTGIIRHDVQWLVCYPLQAGSFVDTDSTYVAQFARYGVPITGNIQVDMGNLYVARSIAQIAAASTFSTREVGHWLSIPGHTESFTNTHYPGGGTYTVGEAEILAIMQAGKDMGVRRRIWLATNTNKVQLDRMANILSIFTADSRNESGVSSRSRTLRRGRR